MRFPSTFPKAFLLLLIIPALLTACARPSATWAGVTATEKVAYLAVGSHLYAIDLQSGNELWRYPEKATSALQFYAAPLLTSDGGLILGSAGSDTALISLDLQSHVERWTFRGAKDHWIATPLEWQGLLYAPNADGYLYILDLNGKLQKSVEVGKRLWATPVSDGTYIYVASLDHFVYAVDPATYQIVWKRDLGGSIAAAPAVAADTLFSGSFASRLHALQLPSGQPRWEAATQGWLWGTPLVVGETVYVNDLKGQLYAFDRASGQLRWQRGPNGPAVAGPTYFGQAIVMLTESGKVHAYDEQGNLLWERALSGRLYTSPAVAADRLLVAPMQGDSLLVALDMEGNLVWTFNPK